MVLREFDEGDLTPEVEVFTEDGEWRETRRRHLVRWLVATARAGATWGSQLGLRARRRRQARRVAARGRCIEGFVVGGLSFGRH